jgi:hypothetical protein
MRPRTLPGMYLEQFTHLPRRGESPLLSSRLPEQVLRTRAILVVNHRLSGASVLGSCLDGLLQARYLG